MNRWLAWVGIIGSGAYATLIFKLAGSKIDALERMPLNEMGDFLAGVFGPVAILWLILGFFQQGHELRQNNEALRLQADELRNSVNQQKEMAGIAGRQLEAELLKANYEREQREAALLPSLRLIANVPSADGSLNVNFYISNQGNNAEDISLYCDDRFVGSTSSLETNQKTLFKTSLPVLDEKYNIRIDYRYGGDVLASDRYEMHVSVSERGSSLARIKFTPVKLD
jgi:hypothetical protein